MYVIYNFTLKIHFDIHYQYSNFIILYRTDTLNTQNDIKIATP